MSLTHTIEAGAPRTSRREKILSGINRVAGFLNVVGLGWLAPILRIMAGENIKEQLRELWHQLFIPMIGLLAFLAAWAVLAPRVTTSLGAIPGPAEVYTQMINLYKDHLAERQKASEFYARLEERNRQLVAEGHADMVRQRAYTGRPTYFDQIVTSLATVALGFFIATLIAVPLGILCGLSRTFNAAFNPLIQIFKPPSRSAAAAPIPE